MGGTGTGTTVATPARAPTSRISSKTPKNHSVAAQTQLAASTKSRAKDFVVSAVTFYPRVYISDASLVVTRQT